MSAMIVVRWIYRNNWVKVFWGILKNCWYLVLYVVTYICCLCYYKEEVEFGGGDKRIYIFWSFIVVILNF